jgi:DNA invertase Pin-like site-specific DNA recombinase
VRKVRCAIYTRKSSEEGLEQEFNSLHAQREACAAYVASQKHEGWVLVPGDYDDGGLSGGSLERPALQRLLEDVRAGVVDQIVVYKIDRLTRSLADFARIVDVLDAAGASFVSVTQSFNTATSMGRLTLNMLLSFAQFEREVTAERIRDKIAASKRKGLWMGGLVPLGYDADGRTLKINAAEADTIRTIFTLYERLGTIREVTEEAGRLGLRTRRRETGDGRTTGGNLFHRGHIHHILTNPLYAGRIRHRDKEHEGQHPALIEPERWNRIQTQLQEGATRQRGKASAKRRSHLCGKINDETGDRLTPSHAKTRAGVRLRYYVSRRLVERSGEAHPGAWRLPADELEARVADLVQQSLGCPGVAASLLPGAPAETIAAASEAIDALRAAATAEGLLTLVERIDIVPGTLTLKLSSTAIAERLSVDPTVIDVTPLTSSHPFRQRKRGVETKLILADAPAARNEALIRNIARAHLWFERIRAGQSFDEVARSTGASKRRIQHMIGLAFLAPDIVRDVLDGRQPAGFTSDWCKSHELPSDWAEQRVLLATL